VLNKKAEPRRGQTAKEPPPPPSGAVGVSARSKSFSSTASPSSGPVGQPQQGRASPTPGSPVLGIVDAVRATGHNPTNWLSHNSPHAYAAAQIPLSPGQQPTRGAAQHQVEASGERPPSSGEPPPPPPPPRRGADGSLKSREESGVASQGISAQPVGGRLPGGSSLGLGAGAPVPPSLEHARGANSHSEHEARNKVGGADAGTSSRRSRGGGGGSESNKHSSGAPAATNVAPTESRRERRTARSSQEGAEEAASGSRRAGSFLGVTGDSEPILEGSDALREEEQERRRGTGRWRGKDGTLRGPAALAAAAATQSAARTQGTAVAGTAAAVASAAVEAGKASSGAGAPPTKAKSKHNKIAWQ